MAKLSKVLKTWITLNEAVRTADEELCKSLLAAELAGRKRPRFVLRIHSRLNRLRAARERLQLKDRV